jgi:hypothetical protein
VRNKLAHLGDPIYQGEYSPLQQARIVARLLVRGILPGGLPRLRHFLRSLPWRSPRKMPLAIVDWICGLAMRDYVERHLEAMPEGQAVRFERRLVALRALVAGHLAAGRAALAARAARVELTLVPDGAAGRRFFHRLGRALDRLLLQRGATVTLSIEALAGAQARHVERLLARLARHGDRVRVVLSARMQRLVNVDSSRVTVVFDGPS